MQVGSKPNHKTSIAYASCLVVPLHDIMSDLGGDSDSTPVSTPGVHVERVVTLVNQSLQLYSCQRR